MPIIAVVLLSVIGFTVRSAIESTMKSNLESQLTTLLSVETAMLGNWYDVQLSNAESLANDLQIRQAVYQILDGDAADHAETSEKLARELGPAMSLHDYVAYFVADESKRIVASSHAVLVDQQEIPEYERFLSRALEGENVVCPPFLSVVMLKNERGKMRMGEPTMYACAPVRDASFQVVAVHAL